MSYNDLPIFIGKANGTRQVCSMRIMPPSFNLLTTQKFTELDFLLPKSGANITSHHKKT